jgi:hypothetical protein
MHEQDPPRDPAGADARCTCGNLLARLTSRGVEVKCRRCKRVTVLRVVDSHRAGRGPPRKAPP